MQGIPNPPLAHIATPSRSSSSVPSGDKHGKRKIGDFAGSKDTKRVFLFRQSKL